MFKASVVNPSDLIGENDWLLVGDYFGSKGLRDALDLGALIADTKGYDKVSTAFSDAQNIISIGHLFSDSAQLIRSSAEVITSFSACDLSAVASSLRGFSVSTSDVVGDVSSILEFASKAELVDRIHYLPTVGGICTLYSTINTLFDNAIEVFGEPPRVSGVTAELVQQKNVSKNVWSMIQGCSTVATVTISMLGVVLAPVWLFALFSIYLVSSIGAFYIKREMQDIVVRNGLNVELQASTVG